MFPWHYRWTVLAFTMLSQSMISGIQIYCFPFWIVPWLDEFKVPRSQLMLIASASVLVAALISPFCGIALDKYRPRWTISIGAVVFALGLLLISMAHSHWEILLLYSLLFPLSLIVCGQLGCQTLISRWFTTNRGTALGISALGVSLGGFIMPPIVTAMLAAFDWRESFQMLALATMLLLMPTTWLVLGKDSETRDSALTNATPHTVAQTHWTTAQLLRNRDFWVIVVCFCSILIAYLPVLYSLGVYARDLGIAQQHAALILSVGAFALGGGKVIFGKLSDRLELRSLYWFASAGIVMSVAIIGMARSWPLLMSAIVVLSFSFGAYVPLLSATVVQRFGSASFGQVLGLVLLFTQLSAVAPFLTGLLQEFSGSYMVAFTAMALPLLIAMLAMRLLSPRPVEP